MPNNGTVSVEVNSSNITILNYIANLSSTLIRLNTTHLDNITNANLTFWNASACTDIDGDSTKLKIQWYNNTILTNEFENKSFIHSENLSTNSKWIVDVSCYDSEEYTSSANTSIQNITCTYPDQF